MHFKVGDIVVAKMGAPYGITTNGWKGKVTRIEGELICVQDLKNNHPGSNYAVHPQHFDLVGTRTDRPSYAKWELG